MTELTEKELKVIKKYCGSDYVQRYNGIMERSKVNSIRVVNTGMLCSGKSSLFNAVIGCTDKEYFPTGAARTTTSSKAYCHNHITYIDTPGIDVNDEDDECAYKTVMEADLIVMVHNIRTGPLNLKEVEWLDRIVSGFHNVQMCKSRLIFVCTWKDTREREAGYDAILEEVRKQVTETVGTEIPFYDVSVKKYQTGISKNKDVLINNSGITQFRTFLEEYALRYLERKPSNDREERNKLLSEIRTILVREADEKHRNMKRIKDRIIERYKLRRSTWNDVFGYFAGRRDRLDDLKTELENNN